MALLALTLALLAMTVATAASEVKYLDMALDSFDDQYQGCRPAMTEALPALNRSEFQKNPDFARVWVNAAAKRREQGSRVSPVPPLSTLSPAQAIAIMAYTVNDLHKQFNDAVQEAGSSPQQYRDNFHFKTMHFLLTDALATLRDSKGRQCHDVFRGVCRFRFKAQRGDIVRFGRFTSTSLSEETAMCFGTNTIFHVHTCWGADIQGFSYIADEKEVLIPPFETFNVTDVTYEGGKSRIWLKSTGTYSKYNCEWLKGNTTGGSIPRSPFHLGGILLATTALAVATGIL
ncbi:NARE ribosyltransferase, partial [Locustella ochotensis]|nr:NARE ribosyltransferase [Locustella ochotensis]